MEEIIQKLKKQAYDSWPGAEGERRSERIETFVRETIGEYSTAFGVDAGQLLASIEAKRTYLCCNFYQLANFPSLKNVRVFKTRADLLASIPSKRFRCPCCKQISKNPYECDSGFMRDDSKVCDWKSWGLLGTMGLGARVAVQEGFIERPKIEEIFMPIEWEAV